MRRIATISIAWVFSFSTLLVAEETEERVLAGYPRVADAAEAWGTWVEYQLAINNVPSGSVGIVHDQQLVFARGFGLANPDAQLPATPETLYSICSISKLFTSVGVMQLRDAGLLRLDDEIGDHLGWFRIRDEHPDDEPLTIRRILSHSAGLPSESDFPYWSGDFTFPTREQVVSRLGEQKTLYPSGRYFQYSNLGLTLAGEILSAVSGRSYSDYVRDQILEPLNMNDTYTDIPKEHHGGRLAVGYSAKKRDGTRDALPIFQAQGIAPAAGFASNVQDLGRFASWQFRLLGEGGDELLRSATLRQMQRVQWMDPDWKTTWGFGFSVSRIGDRTVVGHGGDCPGYRTTIAIDPEAKIAVIVLTNAIGTDVGLYAKTAFDFLAPAIAAALDEPEDTPERDPSMDRYTGIYDSAWGQTAIVRWEAGLAAVPLVSRNPKRALQKLQPVGEHVFRRVRNDDESLGESVIFEVTDDGSVSRMLQHSNWLTKVQ
ncbi:MAG: serine hydrolase domain-containing protein [Pseudomonadota bacterium]